MAILRIYTDGACAGNQSDQNIGGWGAILEYGEHQKELFGGQANTTNNRMELTAVIEAFKALKQTGQKIEVFTDSSYVANCFREEWYVSWEKNHWRNAAKSLWRIRSYGRSCWDSSGSMKCGFSASRVMSTSRANRQISTRSTKNSSAGTALPSASRNSNISPG